MRWVGEASHVMTMGQTFVKLRPGDKGSLCATAVPDHLDVVAELVCGAQLHVGLSQVSGFAPGATLAIYGSERTLQFTEGQLYGGQRGDAKLEPITIPEAERGAWRVEEEFIGAIRGTERVRCTTFEDGLKHMAFTEAVAKSVAEKRGVSLSEFS